MTRPATPPARGAALAAVLAGCVAATAPARTEAADIAARCAAPPTAFARSRPATPATLRAVLADARGGDLIVLDGGRYGAVTLAGDHAGFVGVTARDGARPTLAALTVRGGHWLIERLVIDGQSPGGRPLPATQPGQWPNHPWLVQIRGADNVVFADNVVASRQGPFPWRAESLGADDPEPLDNGVIAENGSCVTLSRNRIFNVFNAVGVEGDQVGDNGKYFRVLGNTIDNFAGDGIDHSVSASVISANVITGGHDLCANLCIHTDAIQGWNYHDHPGIINYDVTIDGNTIIQDMAGDAVLPADDLHGITIFDGSWRDVRVVDNVVVTDTWHGVTLNGVDGLVVANNTVLGTTARGTWIMAGGVTHQGQPSRNVVVRNNIATAIQPPRTAVANMTVDHNLIVDDPRRVVVAFRPALHAYDLHLVAASPAIGRGAPAEAPARDIEGTPRSTPPDLGAYQHRG